MDPQAKRQAQLINVRAKSLKQGQSGAKAYSYTPRKKAQIIGYKRKARRYKRGYGDPLTGGTVAPGRKRPQRWDGSIPKF